MTQAAIDQDQMNARLIPHRTIAEIKKIAQNAATLKEPYLRLPHATMDEVAAFARENVPMGLKIVPEIGHRGEAYPLVCFGWAHPEDQIDPIENRRMVYRIVMIASVLVAAGYQVF